MGDIVEHLRAKADGKRNRVGDLWGDHICRIAADEIERLREALRPFAEIAADVPEDMPDTADVTHATCGDYVTCGHVRAVRAALELSNPVKPKVK